MAEDAAIVLYFLHVFSSQVPRGLTVKGLVTPPGDAETPRRITYMYIRCAAHQQLDSPVFGPLRLHHRGGQHRELPPEEGPSRGRRVYVEVERLEPIERRLRPAGLPLCEGIAPS